MTQKSGPAGWAVQGWSPLLVFDCHFALALKLARRLHVSPTSKMVTFGRVLLWTVVLIAPGGFLLVPVLAAASLHSRGGSSMSFRERLRDWVAEVRRFAGRLFHQRSPRSTRV